MYLDGTNVGKEEVNLTRRFIIVRTYIYHAGWTTHDSHDTGARMQAFPPAASFGREQHWTWSRAAARARRSMRLGLTSRAGPTYVDARRMFPSSHHLIDMDRAERPPGIGASDPPPPTIDTCPRDHSSTWEKLPPHSRKEKVLRLTRRCAPGPRSWTCRHGRGQLGPDRRPAPARLPSSSGEVGVHAPSQQMTRVVVAVVVHHSSSRYLPLQLPPISMGALPHRRRRRPWEPLQHPGLLLVAPRAAGSSMADEGLQHHAISLAAPPQVAW